MGSAQAAPALVRFGVFEVDLRAGELRRNVVRVRIQDLPFRALTLLLSCPGEVIAQEEFRQALWPPDIFVGFEQGISSAVMRLRDALAATSALSFMTFSSKRLCGRCPHPWISATTSGKLIDRDLEREGY
jgi:DNA-binding response OmpR family regulator